MKVRNDKILYPLHGTISSLFVGLIIFFGFLLSWQNYHKTSQIIISAGNQYFDQISGELQLEFRSTYRAVSQAVNILALSSIGQADSLQQRLQSLSMFRAALNNQTQMPAIQVGYGNGDYFIVRSIKSEQLDEIDINDYLDKY